LDKDVKYYLSRTHYRLGVRKTARTRGVN
jgi:hypothetical protein